MESAPHSYLAIDLKSFYASVECVERGLDPLTTNLVVADASRTEKTICLAVSPSLKAHGIGGRARLFEVVQRVRQVNLERMKAAPGRRLTGSSTSDVDLQSHPEWAVDYIVAPPRMSLYVTYSTRIYEIYLKYVAPEDIHIYSVDEVFIDIAPYLRTARKTAHEMAMTMVRDVLRQTGITATAGIGTNLYLAKVAMDIMAKKAKPDSDGVRIAELDERSYRQHLWSHRPLTSFWRVGRGTARRLAAYGVETMGQLARLSLHHEGLLYRLFGVNAELLIDHAWGWESCTIADVKAYRPQRNSFSNGQVLTRPYDAIQARVVAHEMADMMALKLVGRRLVASHVALYVGYDRESLIRPEIKSTYDGEVVLDRYGRPVPKPVHAQVGLDKPTSSSRLICQAVLDMYDRIVNTGLLVRRLGVAAMNVVDEQTAARRQLPLQLDIFVDNADTQHRREAEAAALAKERRVEEARLAIRRRFGKNAILKGLNFAEGATARQRNQQIGGHKA